MEEVIGNISSQRFADIDLGDPFFDSLKQDYVEFSEWFVRKFEQLAYVAYDANGALEGFLYVKTEHGELLDIQPARPNTSRLKVGTFKIDAHGTRLGERFIKKVFDHALESQVDEIYVTVFPRHQALQQILQRYGFRKVGAKTTQNGIEDVLVRVLRCFSGDVVDDYPAIPVTRDRHFLLALYPEWHSRLLPDSLLNTEDPSIVRDVSHSNSIHKTYLTAMKEARGLQRGDTLVIYRTSDNRGPAYRRSVATSICVVEGVRDINDFKNSADFLSYAEPYSVFTREELTNYYDRKKWPILLRFTYNLALRKRITRAQLIEEVGLDPAVRWGLLPIKSSRLRKILDLSQSYESALINKTAFR